MTSSSGWLPVIAACVLATVGNAQARPRRPVLALRTVEREALTAQLLKFLPMLPGETTSACLVVRGGPPGYAYNLDERLLSNLRVTSRPVLAWENCPPTFDEMYVLVDTAGRPINPARPPGYVDPHRVDVVEHGLVGTDSAYVSVRASQGTLNRYYQCSARRTNQRMWRASCVYSGMSVSRLPPNESQQQTSARSAEVIGVSAYRVAIASKRVSRILSRPLAAELGR
jgi:hypothetical protein